MRHDAIDFLYLFLYLLLTLSTNCSCQDLKLSITPLPAFVYNKVHISLLIHNTLYRLYGRQTAFLFKRLCDTVLAYYNSTGCPKIYHTIYSLNNF